MELPRKSTVRKSTAELRLSGSRRVKERESRRSRYGEFETEAPEWLDADSAKLWDRLVIQLNDAGVLRNVDTNALARYCNTWTRWREADQLCKASGSTFETRIDDKKMIRPHPNVVILEKLSAQLFRLELQFGMTPKSRPRIEVCQSDGESVEDDGKIRFFNQG